MIPKDKDEKFIIPDADPELSTTSSFNRPVEEAKKSSDSGLQINEQEKAPPKEDKPKSEEG